MITHKENRCTHSALLPRVLRLPRSLRPERRRGDRRDKRHMFIPLLARKDDGNHNMDGAPRPQDDLPDEFLSNSKETSSNSSTRQDTHAQQLAPNKRQKQKRHAPSACHIKEKMQSGLFPSHSLSNPLQKGTETPRWPGKNNTKTTSRYLMPVLPDTPIGACIQAKAHTFSTAKQNHSANIRPQAPPTPCTSILVQTTLLAGKKRQRTPTVIPSAVPAPGLATQNEGENHVDWNP